MQKIKIGIAAVSMILLAAGSASAAWNTESHTFELELTDGCTIDTSGVTSDLGSYPVGQPDLTMNLGAVKIRCVTMTDYDWGIDRGLSYAPGKRWMGGTATPFPYDLLTDTGVLLGDCGLGVVGAPPAYIETTCPDLSAAGNGFLFTHPGGGAAVNHNLRGTFYTSTATEPGIYSDTVNFVVAWM